MDTFHKVVTVIGLLFAVVYLVLLVLDLFDIQTGLTSVGRILWAGFCLSECVLYWNSGRKLACVWLALGIFYPLFSVVKFFA